MKTEMKELEGVSETALWVAAYRARAGCDPYAALLAGSRGETIIRTIEQGDGLGWGIAVRTRAFDEMVLARAAEVDVVLSLGCGLDARPYRLALPPSLLWIEADLPGLLEYKEGLLPAAGARCRLERVAVDLRDAAARYALFAQTGQMGRRVLVIAEGVLIYLEPGAVDALAAELHASLRDAYLIIDHSSPATVRASSQLWSEGLRRLAPLRFGVEDAAGYFRERGWEPIERRSFAEESLRLKRGPLALASRLAWSLMAPAKRDELRAMNGFMTLRRNS